MPSAARRRLVSFSGNICRSAGRSKRLALMGKVAILFVTVYLLSVPFASQSQAQNPKPRKHAMPMPGMQMGHENHTAAAGLRTGLVKAWNATDPASLASLFSESAVLILPTGKLVTGRQSILEFFQRKVTTTRATLSSIGFENSSELQVDFGIFSESNASASGANRDSNLQNGSVEGKYLMVAKYVGTDWKIQEIIFVVST
jgi:ketosteroid isomerase-like protein